MRKKEEWRERLKYFDLLNNHLNYVKVSEGNTFEHELAKAKEAIKCVRQGHYILTEARLKGDVGRIDFVCLTEGRLKEFLVSEPISSIEKKKLVYPKEFTFEWERVKNG